MPVATILGEALLAQKIAERAYKFSLNAENSPLLWMAQAERAMVKDQVQANFQVLFIQLKGG
ncbi:MAG: hypothetical protein ACPL7L_00290 [bacterium]